MEKQKLQQGEITRQPQEGSAVSFSLSTPNGVIFLSKLQATVDELRKDLAGISGTEAPRYLERTEIRIEAFEEVLRLAKSLT